MPSARAQCAVAAAGWDRARWLGERLPMRGARACFGCAACCLHVAAGDVEGQRKRLGARVRDQQRFGRFLQALNRVFVYHWTLAREPSRRSRALHRVSIDAAYEIRTQLGTPNASPGTSASKPS